MSADADTLVCRDALLEVGARSSDLIRASQSSEPVGIATAAHFAPAFCTNERKPTRVTRLARHARTEQISGCDSSCEPNVKGSLFVASVGTNKRRPARRMVEATGGESPDGPQEEVSAADPGRTALQAQIQHL